MNISDLSNAMNRYFLQDMKLYKTQTTYYLIGTDERRTCWRLLKIDRSEPSHLELFEDPSTYTWQDIKDLLSRLNEGNSKCGGVKLVTKAYGIVGFIKFLKPYYMILVTKRQKVGAICGHSIYGICESKLFRIPHHSVLFGSMSWKIEERYRKLFCSVDLSKDFFYSYTYRAMWCLQKNAVEGDGEGMPFDDMFVWNSFLTHEFRNQICSTHWTIPLVHGFFKQVTLHCEGFNGTLTLIARRSRHFAGTRYFKRGVDAKGRVANDVETEQLVYVEDTDQITSIVQNRGSIPLFWSQETSVWTPKPDISLHRSADPTYEATKLHFKNLVTRYGNPIVILNLAKTKENRPREVILCMEFANAVAVINHGLPKSQRMRFIQCDMHMFMRRKNTDLQDVLESIASEVIDSVGFYYNEKANQSAKLYDPSAENSNFSGKIKDTRECRDEERYDEQQQSVKRSFQHGVLRSNCIDCLDRTNVSQYAFGLVALGQQLQQLGLSQTGHISRGGCIFKSLMEMYNQMGDAIALQYAGSTAHNKVFLQWQGKSTATIQPQEFLRSVMRHYSNAVLDGDRQDAINIFLGHYLPAPDKLSLWEMDSANHLEIRRAGNYSANDLRLSFKRSHSTGDLTEQSGTGSTVSTIESEANSFFVEESSGAKSSLSRLKRRGSTLSQADMQKYLPSDIMISEAIQGSYTESSQASIGNSDVDSLSNYSEDVQQDRLLSTARGSSNFNTALSSPHTQSDITLQPDKYSQNYSNAKASKWTATRNMKSKQGIQGFGDDPISQTFKAWIEEGDTLCF